MIKIVLSENANVHTQQAGEMMLKEKRHKRILSVLQREHTVSIGALASIMPEVSRVTLRRDLAELAEAGALKRTHGGASLPDQALISGARNSPIERQLSSAIDDFDAVILPPIDVRGSSALRRDISRRNIPFIAESAPQQFGTYFGPDNFTASCELGKLAGSHIQGEPVHALMIGHSELSNVQERARGFEAGLREVCGDQLIINHVNGQGNYKIALRVASDALQLKDSINVVFAVNDHSAIAAIEAAERCNSNPAVYAAGGESADFVARLQSNAMLKGVAAFFPDVVGMRAIDAMAAALAGDPLSENITPHAIITPENFHDFYETAPDGTWRLQEQRRETLAGPQLLSARRAPAGKRIGFMPHFPAHDWYRSMIASMQNRVQTYGFELIVTPPHQGIAAEITRLQREVARAAMHRIHPGQVIAIGEGQATLFMANELRKLAFADDPRIQGLTIVTNALDVMHCLEDAPSLKVILTSGEYQAADRCLVGPSLGAIFDHIKPDCAFVTIAGATPGFGISSVDERRALVGQRFVQAAVRTVALADNTIIGSDGNHRIARMADVDEIITDDGVLAEDSQSISAVGVKMSIAGDMSSEVPVQSDRQVLRNT
jgi:DeoR/GlpR family transcriptional regulator of sugar metabolism